MPVLTNYFALLSSETSQSALKTRDGLHLPLSPSAATGRLPLLLLCTTTRRERHELLERESEISEGGQKVFLVHREEQFCKVESRYNTDDDTDAPVALLC